LFGGGSSALTAETWEYDGTAWIHCDSMPGYASTVVSNLAFDELRGRTVVVAATTQNLTTAEWDGIRWSVRDTTSSPPTTFPPIRIDLAYDRVRAECVCVINALTNPALSTRTWNGANWSVRTSSPPFGGSMAFDAASGQVLMASTASGTNTLVSWDGSVWHQQAVALANALQLTSDPWHARVLGVADNGLLFEWRGATFQGLPATGPTGPGTTRALAYDLTLGRLLRLADVAPVASSVTSFHELPAATFAVFGSGCPGPVGTPALAAITGSTPRIGGQFQLQLTGIPNGSSNLAFGLLGTTATAWNGTPLPLALGPLGAPGCALFVAPEVDVPLSPTLLPFAVWPMPIPANLGLIGLDLYVQGAVLVPGFNAAGVVFTNAGHGTIGA
jgi:hypothetical protein